MTKTKPHPCTVCLNRYKDKSQYECLKCTARAKAIDGEYITPPFPGTPVPTAEVSRITKRLFESGIAEAPPAAAAPDNTAPPAQEPPATQPAEPAVKKRKAPKTKKCTGPCQEEKPFGAFSKDAHAKTGMKSRCKICENAARKQSLDRQRSLAKAAINMLAEKQTPSPTITQAELKTVYSSTPFSCRENPKPVPLPEAIPGVLQEQEFVQAAANEGYLNGGIILDDAHVVYLDFSNHQPLLKALERKASQEMRPLYMQILWACRLYAGLPDLKIPVQESTPGASAEVPQ